MTRRSVVLAFLVVLSVLTYLDRVCITVAATEIQKDLHISTGAWGWVLGAFFLSYGLFEMPTGALGDRRGHRRVLTRIVLWWSGFTALTGVVSHFSLLLATRFLFGAGEAGAYPNIAGALGRWFQPTERARAQGAVWAASRVGGALSPLLVVPLMTALGWRATFYLLGAAGVVWAAAWFSWYRDRPAAGSGGDHAAGVPWRALFRSRGLWVILAMAWCYGWGASFYLSWMPTYLEEGRHISRAELAAYAALPFVMGMFGNLTGGFLSDHLARKLGLRLGRQLVGTTSLALAALLVLAAALTSDKLTAVAAVALGYGVMDCMLPASWANCLDVGGPYAGAVSGAMNTAVQAGATISIVLFGYLVELFDRNYNAPLFVIAGFVLASAAFFSRIDPTKPLLPAEPARKGEAAACV